MEPKQPEENQDEQTWSLNAPYVQRALGFIRRRGKRGVTAELLVQWDAQNGRRLFCWRNEEAAALYRLHQARLFLNSFRGVFERMRLRRFINVPAGDETGLTQGVYLDAETISQDERLRQWAIRDLTSRGRSIASELLFWKLSESERGDVLKAWEAALTGRESAA